MQFGLDNAYILDGGSSSTIALINLKINSPSSHMNRMVGDCIWFATLVKEETWREEESVQTVEVEENK